MKETGFVTRVDHSQWRSSRSKVEGGSRLFKFVSKLSLAFQFPESDFLVAKSPGVELRQQGLNKVSR